MRLIPVDPRTFDLERIRWAFASFADRSCGKYSVDSYFDDVRAATAQAWLGVDGDEIKAVAMTEMSSDDMRTVRLTACTGVDAKEWVHLVQGIQAHAKKAGAKSFEAIARPGWERYLKNFGFRKTHVILEAPL